MRGQFRKQATRKDVLDVSRAALDFSATVRDFGHQILVPAQLGAIIFEEALANAIELKGDDLANDVIGKREIRNDRTAAKEGRLEQLQKLRPQRFGEFFGIRGACSDRRTTGGSNPCRHSTS